MVLLGFCFRDQGRWFKSHRQNPAFLVFILVIVNLHVGDTFGRSWQDRVPVTNCCRRTKELDEHAQCATCTVLDQRVM